MEDKQIVYITTAEAVKRFGFERRTLFNYGTRGDVKFILKKDLRNRLYDLESIVKYLSKKSLNKQETVTVTIEETRKILCYVRNKLVDPVENLTVRINKLSKKYPSSELVYDHCDKFKESKLFTEVMTIDKLNAIDVIVLYNKIMLPKEIVYHMEKLCKLYDVEMIYL